MTITFRPFISLRYSMSQHVDSPPPLHYMTRTDAHEAPELLALALSRRQRDREPDGGREPVTRGTAELRHRRRAWEGRDEACGASMRVGLAGAGSLRREGPGGFGGRRKPAAQGSGWLWRAREACGAKIRVGLAGAGSLRRKDPGGAWRSRLGGEPCETSLLRRASGGWRLRPAPDSASASGAAPSARALRACWCPLSPQPAPFTQATRS